MLIRMKFQAEKLEREEMYSLLGISIGFANL